MSGRIAPAAAALLLALAGVASLVVGCTQSTTRSSSAAAAKPAAPAKPAAAAPAKPKPKPKPVRPETSPPFDHKSHVARGVGCADCHTGAETEDKAGLPTIETCMECHEEFDAKAPPEKKIENFVDAKTKAPLWNRFAKQPGYVQFSHKSHAAKQVACADCHGKMEESVRTGPELFLGMPACTACHEKRSATADCAACHPTIRKDTKPPNHDAKWQAAHGAASRIVPEKGSGDDCALCHTKEKCAECHSGTKPASHDAKWQAAHGPLVRASATAGEDTSCAMCHTDRNCAQCHERTKPANHERLWDVRHGQIVRRGSFDGPGEDCAMCHTENLCIQCHRDEKPRDHTVSWLVGPAHGLAAAFDRERCVACHREDSCTECHTTNPPRSHHGSWGAPRNRHCIGCHQTPGSEGGCFACHKGLQSHRQAPAKPAGHQPDWECLVCHDRLKHPVNDQNCNECHR